MKLTPDDEVHTTDRDGLKSDAVSYVSSITQESRTVAATINHSSTNSFLSTLSLPKTFSPTSMMDIGVNIQATISSFCARVVSFGMSQTVSLALARTMLLQRESLLSAGVLTDQLVPEPSTYSACS